MRFRFHIHSLDIDFPKDCLMKMFMVTLEEEARFWYEGLPPTSICSLRDFFSSFCKKYNRGRPSKELIENLCGYIEDIMLYLGVEVDDRALVKDEIKEAPLKYDCQSRCSSEELVSKPWLQEEHVQEVVFLDTSEEQGYIEDQLVEEHEVAPFFLTDNRTDLSHPPRYDEFDDDSCEQPILETSLGSDPIYNDSASY